MGGEELSDDEIYAELRKKAATQKPEEKKLDITTTPRGLNITDEILQRSRIKTRRRALMSSGAQSVAEVLNNPAGLGNVDMLGIQGGYLPPHLKGKGK